MSTVGVVPGGDVQVVLAEVPVVTLKSGVPVLELEVDDATFTSGAEGERVQDRARGRSRG